MAMGMLLPLIPMILPIIMLGVAMILLGDIFFMMLKMIPKFLKIAMNLFRPEAFIKDLVFGVFKSIYMIIDTIGDIILSTIRTIFNSIFGQSLGGIFGHGEQRHPGTGKKFKPKGKVCKSPPNFFYYIILLLCPPVYVFMVKGLSGWIYILITIALTLMFYFPGLLYALIVCPF
jgi:uncharacterized membrane protein YqaE (UPF0057 family)